MFPFGPEVVVRWHAEIWLGKIEIYCEMIHTGEISCMKGDEINITVLVLSSSWASNAMQ